MKKLILFLSLFFSIYISLEAQSIATNTFNGRVSIQTATNVADSTWAITGYFSNSVQKYTASQIAVNDRFYVQIGVNTYRGRVSVVNSPTGNLISIRIVCNLPSAPPGVAAIIRETSNGYPVYVDGIANNLQAGIQNYFANTINSVAIPNPCEQTVTQAAHGFRDFTPVRWNPNTSTYERPTNDTLVPDYIVVDSLTVNTFKVANCGTYTTALANGLYWFTSASPGYSLTADTTKVPLFQALNGKLILNPIVGFNLMSGGGSGDVTRDELADSTAAVRADFPSGVTDGDKGEITVTSGVWTIDNGVVTSAKVASQTLDSTDLKNRGTTLIKLAQSGATNGQVPKYNSTSGNWEPGADNTGGGGSPGGATTNIQINDSGSFYGDSTLTYDKTTRALNYSGNKFKILSNIANDRPPMVEFRRIFPAGSEYGRGSVGFLGGSEMNMSVNMDYTNGTHRYYDRTKPAIWMYLENTAGTFGLQYTAANHPNNDSMWSVYGKVIFEAERITNAGEAVQYGSVLKTQRIHLIDGNYTSPAGQIYLTGTQFRFDGGLQMNMPTIRVGNTSTSFFPDGTAIATYKKTGANTYVVYANEDNSTAYNQYRYIKNKAGSYNLGSGQKVVEWDINGGVAYSGWRATATVLSSFSNVEAYWKTTNSAGTNADRMVLSQEGNLGIGVSSPTAVLHLKAGTATASTAPLKFTSGTNLTTPEAGALEYDGTEFYATNSTASRTTLARVLKGSGTLDFGSTAAGAITDLTITVTGAADGDVVSLSVPNASQTTTGSFSAWVSATNTVTVRYRIAALTGSEDPASGTFKVTVTK